MDGTVKCYFKDSSATDSSNTTTEIVRIDLDSIQSRSIEELYNVIRDEFEFEDSFSFRVKYLVRVCACVWMVACCDFVMPSRCLPLPLCYPSTWASIALAGMIHELIRLHVYAWMDG